MLILTLLLTATERLAAMVKESTVRLAGRNYTGDAEARICPRKIWMVIQFYFLQIFQAFGT